jgi:hypothetical protein
MLLRRWKRKKRPPKARRLASEFGAGQASGLRGPSVLAASCATITNSRDKLNRMDLERSKEIARSFKRELIVYQRVLRDERTPLAAGNVIETHEHAGDPTREENIRTASRELFRITAPSTRHDKLLQLVGALFHQWGRKANSETACFSRPEMRGDSVRGRLAARYGME